MNHRVTATGSFMEIMIEAKTSASEETYEVDNLTVAGSGGIDNCPNDPDKTAPGECGCGVPEGSCGIADADGQVGISIKDSAAVVALEAFESMDANDPRFEGQGSGKPEHLPFGLIHFKLVLPCISNKAK
jgi:hypothetical protein